MKTALKLLLVFVEYSESNAPLFIYAVNSVASTTGQRLSLPPPPLRALCPTFLPMTAPFLCGRCSSMGQPGVRPRGEERCRP